MKKTVFAIFVILSIGLNAFAQTTSHQTCGLLIFDDKFDSKNALKFVDYKSSQMPYVDVQVHGALIPKIRGLFTTGGALDSKKTSEGVLVEATFLSEPSYQLVIESLFGSAPFINRKSAIEVLTQVGALNNPSSCVRVVVPALEN